MTEDIHGVRFENRGLVLMAGDRPPVVCPERVLVELADFAGPATLATGDALALAGALQRLEDAYDERHGWDRPPEVYLIRTTGLGAATLPVALCRLRIPCRVWRRSGNPADTLTALAGRVARLPRNVRAALVEADVSRATLIGALLVSEAWWIGSIPSDVEAAGRTVRLMQAVDVDGRVYQITRCRCCARRTASTLTPKEFTDVVGRFTGAHGDTGSTPEVVGALTALAHAFNTWVGP